MTLVANFEILKYYMLPSSPTGMKMKTVLLLCFFIGSSLLLVSNAHSQTDPEARISDSPTSIIGFNHIGLSVQDLPAMVAFYQDATGFELVKREKVSQQKNADLLLGIENVAYETVVFKAPGMFLELTAYEHQKNAEPRKMPPEGPGMTHTCFQSPSWNPGYDKFVQAGVSMLSRGEGPVDLGGYGVTYAYAHDPEGNMLELEQLSKDRLGLDSVWVEQHPMWMTQVALMSPDVDRLAGFYQTVLDMLPNRKGSFNGNPRLDDIVDVDSVALHATWFKMDGPHKMLELMQYEHPLTPASRSPRHPTDLGYTFSFEVEDIQQEYQRLKKLGVAFVSEPQILGAFWMVYAHDLDGNVFSLREPTSPASMYSLHNNR